MKGLFQIEQNGKNRTQFYQFLGLAAKAGAIVYGSAAVDQAIKKRKLYLVLVDGGASENTKKAFADACRYYKTPIVVLEEIDMLGSCLGKPDKKVIGIKDTGFANSAIKKYGLGSGGEKLEQNKNS